MRWRFGVIVVFTALSILFTQWPEAWQPLLNLVYGEKLYPKLQQLLGFIPSPKNFAVADVLWVLIPVLFLIRIAWLWRVNLARRLPLVVLEVGLWVSGFYFAFMVVWGLNYQTKSLYSQLTEQGFTRKLSEGHFEFALQETLKAIENLPEDFDTCGSTPNNFSNQRPSAFAHSAMALANLPPAPARTVSRSAWTFYYEGIGLAGVYIPFTGEPTVSRELFELGQPFVMTHEYAHWAGFAHEYDADIIAYWSLWMSPDPRWQYSGWLEWWMSIAEPEVIQSQFPAELQMSLSCYRAFVRAKTRWKIRDLHWKVYETNLKNQGIKEGLKSYKMGEAMALSSYQDWLHKKRNR